MSSNTLAVLIGMLLGSVVHGQVATEELRLWEGVTGFAGSTKDAVYEGRNGAHPNRWLHGVTDPVATLYRPDEAAASGAAVVVLPGGGYSGQAIDKEGHYVARWLAQRGLAALVSPYRCGDLSRRHPTPLADAQRAIRVLRSRASEWDVDPKRVGVMGFSAGGHLAATVATHSGEPLPGIEDPYHAIPARPDFAVLVYPVISMRWEVAHAGSRRNLMGETEAEELVALLSADEQVTAQTPPTFIVHSVDDKTVPVANATRFYEACRQHNVPVELHLYETGGHGYGMWATVGSATTWPTVLEGWLSARNLVTNPSR